MQVAAVPSSGAAVGLKELHSTQPGTQPTCKLVQRLKGAAASLVRDGWLARFCWSPASHQQQGRQASHQGPAAQLLACHA